MFKMLSVSNKFRQIVEITKNAFDSILAEPRAQRNRVNEAFLEAHHRMEEQHKGFGINFWGSVWRFRLYDDIYSAARGADGAPLPCTQRYAHLKERLVSIAEGKDAWLKGPAASDPHITREVISWDGVRQFCREWRALIDREEERDAERARWSVEAAATRAAGKAARAAASQARGAAAARSKEAASDTAG